MLTVDRSATSTEAALGLDDKLDGQAAASEARHRLANVFQLLSTLTRMRIQRSQDEEARRQLAWMLDAITALALIHDRPPDAPTADFSRLLRDMAPLWRRRCDGRPITIELDLAPLAVHQRHEAALTLIAHELVVNAIAHGYPGDASGVIHIAFGPDDEGRGALEVGDDGVGYDPQTVARNRLGLWLIGGLASQVQGVLTTDCDEGVQARLVFPLPPVETAPN
jgi:two-component sensor histidine kinase